MSIRGYLITKFLSEIIEAKELDLNWKLEAKLQARDVVFHYMRGNENWDPAFREASSHSEDGVSS